MMVYESHLGIQPFYHQMVSRLLMDFNGVLTASSSWISYLKLLLLVGCSWKIALIGLLDSPLRWAGSSGSLLGNSKPKVAGRVMGEGSMQTCLEILLR